MALQLSLAMVLVIVQITSETKVLKLLVPEHGILRVTELCCRNPGQLFSHPRCLHNINVFCSVRKSQQELVSMNCRGLLCQLLDEFAAVEAASS